MPSKLLDINYWIDFVFPRSNSRHSSIHAYLTNKEIDDKFSKLKVLDGQQRKYIDGIFIATKYDLEVQKLFDRVKFGLEYKIIDDFVELLYQKIWVDCQFFIPNPDLLVPVPDDPKRQLQRGFSVSGLIAKKLSNKLNIPVLEMITKTKDTQKQATLDRKERTKNLKNAFKIVDNLDYNFGKKEVLWIVDDITTTGSTIYECAKIIKKEYPFLKIYGIVISGN